LGFPDKLYGKPLPPNGGFSYQIDTKTSGGRPRIFYSEMGIYTVAMLAKTDIAKAFRRILIEIQRQAQAEKRDGGG